MGLHVPFNNCELHTRTHHPQSKNRNNEALKLRVSLSPLARSQKFKKSVTMWKTESENAIRVCVRVRPLNEKERQTSKDIADVSMKHNTITIKDPKDDQFDPVDVLHRSYEKVCYFIFSLPHSFSLYFVTNYTHTPHNITEFCFSKGFRYDM